MPDYGRPRPTAVRGWARIALLGGGLVLALTLTGCSGVPTSGSVHIARVLPAVGGQDDSNVRQLPSGPLDGMKPVRLVAGFLDALVDSDSDFGVARQFLAHGTSWDSDSRTTVYTGDPTIKRVESGVVEISYQRVGTIDSRGAYRVEPGAAHVRVHVVRLRGKWRISQLPAGALLSTTDAQRLLQPADVYFLNRSQASVVPVPMLVSADEPGLATTLINGLLAGPGPRLAGTVVSAVPAGTTLIGNVLIDGSGVAEVDLSANVRQSPTQALQRMSAQIVWTLRQVPAVTAVRLLSNGAPLSAVDVATVQPKGSYPEYNPDIAPTRRGALVSTAGRVASIPTGSVPTPLQQRPLYSPAVSADGAVVAALRSSRSPAGLAIGTTDGTLRAPVPASTFTAPVFDPADDAFVADRTAARTSVVEITPAGKVHPVPLPASVAIEGIDAIAVSRDGSRVAMTVGSPDHSALLVGGIGSARGHAVFRGLSVVIPAAQDAMGVAWGGVNEILTTVRSTVHRRIVESTSVNGFQVVAFPTTGLPSSPMQVAASPGQPVLAGAAGGIWRLTSGRWQRVATGVDPSYAG